MSNNLQPNPLWREVYRLPQANHITDNLWLGAEPVRALPERFRTVVACVPIEYRVPEGVTIVQAPFLDDDAFDPPWETVERGVQAVARARAPIGYPVLVHCAAGFNRSGLVLALALVRGGLSPKEAIALLRRKRSDWVLCNPRFEAIVLHPSQRGCRSRRRQEHPRSRARRKAEGGRE